MNGLGEAAASALLLESNRRFHNEKGDLNLKGEEFLATFSSGSGQEEHRSAICPPRTSPSRSTARLIAA